ncbi:MAG: S9 family peptidase [Acidobacteria bacterium]|nr:MAG: S9 family peptidase [Acidobacteriota bacterium]
MAEKSMRYFASMRSTRSLVFALALSTVFYVSVHGQPDQAPATLARAPYKPARMTEADYARAEKMLAAGTTPLVQLANVQPNWLAGGKFWYRGANNALFLVDPAAKTKIPCDVNGVACKPDGPVGPAAPAGAGRGGRAGGQGRAGGAPSVASPDGKRAAYIKDFNLWVRDVATGKETQLTSDGIKDFGYATNNAGWTKSDAPVVVWSPDSTKIATFQHDARGTGDMYLIRTNAGHPELSAWKYPLPGDDKIFMIERVIIDVDLQKVTRLKMPADPHRSTLCDHVVCGGSWSDVEWAPDSKSLAFVSTSRDHRQENLRVTDLAGNVRDILEEKVATFFESGNGRVNWHYLPNSKEFIWFSERDNWGQLYLYDDGGKLKNQITTGEGNVTQLVKIDEKNRLLYFWAVGKEKGRDPYFRHFYKIGFDGKGLTLLTPANGDHAVAWSPDEKFLIDTYSTPDTPPVVELRDASNGALVLPLEKSDISKLVASGWQAPVPITVKCRDGVTDCYGILHKPYRLDPTKKYPIINKIYPGPQTGSVGGRTFSASRGDDGALAQLGFAVVEIDGMGTPWRSKKFHEAYYANMGDNTLPDQVAGMKELAKKYPWIDIDRAGIWGHSGGGFATADAMFRYPDFFKVGISESGNHDNRVYEDDWAEKWQGLLGKDSTVAGYVDAANQTHAANLKGKLLLAHGTMDNNVPPDNTLLVVDALIKANKDFDLLMIPNAGHGYGAASNYMMRRRWDYFTKWLLGVEPPKQYEIGR